MLAVTGPAKPHELLDVAFPSRPLVSFTTFSVPEHAMLELVPKVIEFLSASFDAEAVEFSFERNPGRDEPEK